MAYAPSSAAMPRPAPSASPMAHAHGNMGFFQPGTKVQVGNHRVVVERYLSEGGFAHVYVVRVPTASGNTTTAVLKRVAVPDKEALASLRTEVETMKKLKGHKHIVTYIDSHASQLKGGGYEVFLLMEFCDGGGLIDFMNTRLKNRLTEPEILKIFSDAAEGVACMHYLKPPLLHRDLKVENILISSAGGTLYKLCDFGSTAPPRPAARSVVEGKLIEDDVQRHTTLQYRSPEMIDVYRRQPIDEKSDIWALGVLLYKLCYYTTPFEEQGQMAILTAKFKYPAYPRFSDRLKKLIAEMLTEDPKKRPNIYQVLKEVCEMRGRPVPIKDIYAARTPSEARSNQRLPDAEPNVKPAEAIGAQRVPMEQTKYTEPEITPMRRGRPRSPSKQGSATVSAAKKERDPFAALDSPSFSTRSKAIDEMSARFPPADQFAILQNKRTPFDFEGAPGEHSSSLDHDTNAMADEAFGMSGTDSDKEGGHIAREAPTLRVARAMSLEKATKITPPRVRPDVAKADIEKPLPARPSHTTAGAKVEQEAAMKSAKPPIVSDRPIWRVPLIRTDRSPQPPPDRSDSLQPPRRPSIADRPRPSSQFIDRTSYRASEAPRASMDALRPPALDIPQSLHRSRSADEPTLSPTKTERWRLESEAVRNASRGSPHGDLIDTSDGDIAVVDSGPSSVDYLRGMENEGALPPREKGHHRRSSSMFKHLKHASMPPMPGSGGKNIFGGKFGSAFKRFETNAGNSRRTSEKEESEAVEQPYTNGNTPARVMSPEIADLSLVETEELPPEVRRELERRRLSLEEKRVAEAGAAHRAGLSSGSRAGPNRASAIQNRVKDLLDESGRTAPVKKTASGYGKYTNEESKPQHASTMPLPSAATSNSSMPRQLPPTRLKPPEQVLLTPASAPPIAVAPVKSPRPAARPTAPPKPVALQTKAADPRAVITDPSELDWQYDFSARYPDLSIDMVESEIAGAQTPPRASSLRVREV